jgi:peptide deformylase
MAAMWRVRKSQQEEKPVPANQRCGPFGSGRRAQCRVDKAEIWRLLITMALRITLYEEPILRTKGKKITSFDQSLRDLVQEMIATMKAAHGIGIAAQQVGHALQVCIVDVSECEDDFDYVLDGRRPPLDLIMPLAVVNPELEFPDGPSTVYEEGCLSFPGINGDVKRPDEVRLKYQDLDGNPHTIECNGIFGRCIQHEVDHLNGILFIDRMHKKTRKKLEDRLQEMKAQTATAT